MDELSLLLDSLCWTCYFYFLFDNSCARVVFVFFSAAVIAWSTVCKFSLATWFSMACCCTPMQIVAKDDTPMAHPATGLPWLISQDTSVVAQLVHRVRLDDVHAKLAMRRGERRQNQISIIFQMVKVGLGGSFVLSGTPRTHAKSKSTTPSEKRTSRCNLRRFVAATPIPSDYESCKSKSRAEITMWRYVCLEI